MANTFPSSGNVGIGTTSPPNLLTVDSGSSLGIARITGRSPAWHAGSGDFYEGEAKLGLVSVPGDHLAGSNVGDSFFFHRDNTYKIRALREEVRSLSSGS